VARPGWARASLTPRPRATQRPHNACEWGWGSYSWVACELFVPLGRCPVALPCGSPCGRHCGRVRFTKTKNILGGEAAPLPPPPHARTRCANPAQVPHPSLQPPVSCAHAYVRGQATAVAAARGCRTAPAPLCSECRPRPDGPADQPWSPQSCGYGKRRQCSLRAP
jgi:hypothetical protein